MLGGLRCIRRHPLVRPLVLALALCELGLSSTLNVGLLLLNAERGWGPSGYGWIVGAFGAGAAAGAALLTVVGWVPRAGLVLSGALGIACARLTGLAAGTAGSLDNSLLQNAADPAVPRPGHLGRHAHDGRARPAVVPGGGGGDRRLGRGPGLRGDGGVLGLRYRVPAPQPRGAARQASARGAEDATGSPGKSLGRIAVPVGSPALYTFLTGRDSPAGKSESAVSCT
ncbi:hypothetical protein [Streptomyces sp. SolWspMP-sol7th]|uniref:hypothetical protein n=1 Tax=Streptomyces sp. SolWspMP-sol7th TaxID=1839776 RepID=UPI0026D6301C